jgi:hypothetical protein
MNPCIARPFHSFTPLPNRKWLADPSGAFDHLSRYNLYALLQMGTAGL